jgi:pimeloyl-ACP methyl ester carboxylesterase
MTEAKVTEHDVQAPDGRNLHVYEAGAKGGTLVLVHHGTPGSGLLAPAWVQDATERGIRLVGFDRAGYGLSDRRPGRSIADNVRDSALVVESLGADTFRTWGVSGGGPHALACAALLPEQVRAAVSVAGVGPADAPDLDFMAGMGQDNIEEFGAAFTGADELAKLLAPAREAMLAGGPDGLVAALESVLPPVDQAMIHGDFADFMFTWMTAGLRPGYDGWLDDDLAFVHPWGFTPASITVPVMLLQGRQDLMVPFAHGEWLGRSIPGVTAEFSEKDGHVSLHSQLGRVHAWLLEH